MTRAELDALSDMIVEKLAFVSKPILNADEAARYLGIKKHTLYKKTCHREIPFFKPCGHAIYFKKADLDEWVTSSRVATDAELKAKAQRYCNAFEFQPSYHNLKTTR